GFTLHETVAEYVQMITVKARELPTLKWEISPKLPAISKAKLKRFPVPVGMPPDQEITIYGGGSLIFSEYGQLKYHIRNKILNADRQSSRIKCLWDSGFFDQDEERALRFADIHRLRWTDDPEFSPMEVRHGQFF